MGFFDERTAHRVSLQDARRLLQSRRKVGDYHQVPQACDVTLCTYWRHTHKTVTQFILSSFFETIGNIHTEQQHSLFSPHFFETTGNIHTKQQHISFSPHFLRPQPSKKSLRFFETTAKQKKSESWILN